MGKYRITLDGKTYEIEVEAIVDELEPAPAPQKDQRTSWSAKPGKGSSPVVQIIDSAAERQADKNDRIVVSPMPGTVLRIVTSVGERVKKDQPLLLLEAMKMENEIAAPRDGLITAVCVKEGQTVSGGETLFEIGE